MTKNNSHKSGIETVFVAKEYENEKE